MKSPTGRGFAGMYRTNYKLRKSRILRNFGGAALHGGVGVEHTFGGGAGEYRNKSKCKWCNTMKRDTTILKRARKLKGRKCYICGEDGAEMHHLIPLWMGGEDAVNNMIPLCTWHHMLMHKARSMRNQHEHKSTSGRPRAVAHVDGYKDVLNDYIECRIGHAECCERLGLSGKSRVKDTPWFKEYKQERGIKRCRNIIDCKRKGYVDDGAFVGYIEYENGERKEFYWRAA